MAAHQAPRPWDSPGKITGVGCHFLLQCMKVKSEREVPQSCLTLSDPMDYSLPGSSIHGIFQAKVLEWGAIAFSEKGYTNLQFFHLPFPELNIIIFVMETYFHISHAICIQRGRRMLTDLPPFAPVLREGNGTPLQYSCLENPMDGGAW